MNSLQTLPIEIKEIVYYYAQNQNLKLTKSFNVTFADLEIIKRPSCYMSVITLKGIDLALLDRQIKKNQCESMAQCCPGQKIQ